MSFPRYPKYKASGVEWLGDVPEGWTVKALRYLCYCLDGSRVPLNSTQRAEKQGEVPYWGANSIVDYVDEALFDEDLVLLGEDGAPFFDKLKPIAFFSMGKVWPNNHVHVLRPVGADTGKFIAHALNITDFAHFIDGSTRDKLTQGSMKAIPLPCPPLPEQTAIAEFLDRETGKIDELVAEQRRLMELLKEKRQAVISHAVTKGLNPHAPMKPSGIEWLGDVPEGWVIGKLGYACKLKGGFAFAAGDFGTDGVAVVKMNNLKRGRLDLSEAARIPESSCNESVSLCEGDLVWGMSGSTGETGSLGNFARVCGADLPCQLNQRVGRFKADFTKLELNFIEQVIQTPYFYEQIMLLVTGTAQYNVSSEQVQSCIFALPPLFEQTAIVEFLRTELAKFDTLTAEAQRAIDLLQERRTALISAAVTGQIDVRKSVV